MKQDMGDMVRLGVISISKGPVIKGWFFDLNMFMVFALRLWKFDICPCGILLLELIHQKLFYGG